MSDSFSDRWIHWFEEQNPHLKRNQEAPSTHDGCKVASISQPRPQVTTGVSRRPQAASQTEESAYQFSFYQKNLPKSNTLGSASVDLLIAEAHALRLRLNMTQRAFAEQLGISPSVMTPWFLHTLRG